jgi:two-component sensor histidine kinase
LFHWFWRTLPVWLLLLAGGAFSWTLGGLIKRGFEERLVSEEEARLRLVAEQKAAQHERFMRELNHRVKNNLALVDGLIGFQMRKQGGIDGAELRARVRAISDVHDLLYRAADSYHVDLGTLLLQLCASPALVPRESGVLLSCDAEKGTVVDAGRATSLALVVVELVTNAVKHAFPNRSDGRIWVAASSDGKNLSLTIRDDGIGIPEAPARNSGTKIVQAMVEQVGGTLSRTNDNGTFYRIIFPLQNG